MYHHIAPHAHMDMKHRILIIVQNLPVPFDRRVWLECQALTSAGYRVAVVCPKGKGDPEYQVIDRVEIYKYKPYAPGGSKVSFVAEYAYSFVATAWHTLKARVKGGRFAVIQACNPPDIFWPLALAFRLERTKFVFDHHDLCPELFLSRFEGGPKLPYMGLLWLERRTHRTANHVISTNDSYRQIAIERSGKSPEDVTVVRTGPDPDKLKRSNAIRRAQARTQVPSRLHRGDGATGRRRHRGARRRHHRARDGARRHRLHDHRLR